MSKKPFKFMWKDEILSSNLKANTRYVLLILESFMDINGENCFPSMELIAEKSGLTKRCVVTHIGNAHKAGWVKIEQRQRSGKSWKRNFYIPQIPHKVSANNTPLSDLGDENDANGSENNNHLVGNDMHSNNIIDYTSYMKEREPAEITSAKNFLTHYFSSTQEENFSWLPLDWLLFARNKRSFSDEKIKECAEKFYVYFSEQKPQKLSLNSWEQKWRNWVVQERYSKSPEDTAREHAQAWFEASLNRHK